MWTYYKDGDERQRLRAELTFQFEAPAELRADVKPIESLQVLASMTQEELVDHLGEGMSVREAIALRLSKGKPTPLFALHTRHRGAFEFVPWEDMERLLDTQTYVRTSIIASYLTVAELFVAPENIFFMHPSAVSETDPVKRARDVALFAEMAIGDRWPKLVVFPVLVNTNHWVIVEVLPPESRTDTTTPARVLVNDSMANAQLWQDYKVLIMEGVNALFDRMKLPANQRPKEPTERPGVPPQGGVDCGVWAAFIGRVRMLGASRYGMVYRPEKELEALARLDSTKLRELLAIELIEFGRVDHFRRLFKVEPAERRRAAKEIGERVARQFDAPAAAVGNRPAAAESAAPAAPGLSVDQALRAAEASDRSPADLLRLADAMLSEGASSARVPVAKEAVAAAAAKGAPPPKPKGAASTGTLLALPNHDSVTHRQTIQETLRDWPEKPEDQPIAFGELLRTLGSPHAQYAASYYRQLTGLAGEHLAHALFHHDPSLSPDKQYGYVLQVLLRMWEDYPDGTVPGATYLDATVRAAQKTKTIKEKGGTPVRELVLLRRDVVPILACALFGILPRRPPAYEEDKATPADRCHDLSVLALFAAYAKDGGTADHALAAKLKCVLAYFAACADEGLCTQPRDLEITGQPRALVMRRLTVEASFLTELTEPLPGSPLPRLAESAELFERQPLSFVRPDFANRTLGGGVLGHGSVQEEIQFVTHTECLVATHLMSPMDDREAIAIVGARQFCDYRGYAASFKYTGLLEPNHLDKQSFEFVYAQAYRVHRTYIMCIDAESYGDSARSASAQLTATQIKRERIKALLGFMVMAEGDKASADMALAQHFPDVLLGRWGCGVFAGDAVLKLLLQLRALAIARANKYPQGNVRYVSPASDSDKQVLERYYGADLALVRALEKTPQTVGWLDTVLKEIEGKQRKSIFRKRNLTKAAQRFQVADTVWEVVRTHLKDLPEFPGGAPLPPPPTTIHAPVPAGGDEEETETDEEVAADPVRVPAEASHVAAPAPAEVSHVAAAAPAAPAAAAAAATNPMKEEEEEEEQEVGPASPSAADAQVASADGAAEEVAPDEAQEPGTSA